MRCHKCKGDLTPFNGSDFLFCPLCGEKVQQANTSVKQPPFDNIKDALYFIFENYGVEGLLSGNYIADLAPMLKEERKVIKLLKDDGALDVLKNGLGTQPSEHSITVKRAISRLSSFLQESSKVVGLIYDFAEALGWQVASPTPVQTAPPVVNVAQSPQPAPTQPQQPPFQKSSGIEVAPKVGSLYKFGKYDWRVLDVQNGQALLLSDKVIGQRAYHATQVDVTWEKCSLRSYLNGEFYNSFGQEKSRISNERITANSNNLRYDTLGGNDIRDWIFLLSIDEVCRFSFFGDSTASLREAKNKGNPFDFINDGNNNARIAKGADGKACCWWLRSPGDRSGNAASVLAGGGVYAYGTMVSAEFGGVRPALWLNL